MNRPLLFEKLSDRLQLLFPKTYVSLAWSIIDTLTDEIYASSTSMDLREKISPFSVAAIGTQAYYDLPHLSKLQGIFYTTPKHTQKAFQLADVGIQIFKKEGLFKKSDIILQNSIRHKDSSDNKYALWHLAKSVTHTIADAMMDTKFPLVIGENHEKYFTHIAKKAEISWLKALNASNLKTEMPYSTVVKTTSEFMGFLHFAGLRDKTTLAAFLKEHQGTRDITRELARRIRPLEKLFRLTAPKFPITPFKNKMGDIMLFSEALRDWRENSITAHTHLHPQSIPSRDGTLTQHSTPHSSVRTLP